MNPDRLQRQFALGDFALFSALAIPGIGGFILDAMIQVNQHLAWPGSLALSPLSYLLVHLMGVLGAAFAFVRIRVPPGRELGAVSIAVKLSAAALFCIGVSQGAPAIFLLVAAVDLVQGLTLLVTGASKPRTSSTKASI